MYPALSTSHFELSAKRQSWIQNENVLIIGLNVIHNYLLAALQDYDRSDTAACLSFYGDFLLKLGRIRLHDWYALQQPKLWNEEVDHHDLADEPVFEPMVPFRTFRQMLGINHAANTMAAATMAMDANFGAPSGINPRV
jgi:hypothetical protein